MGFYFLSSVYRGMIGEICNKTAVSHPAAASAPSTAAAAAERDAADPREAVLAAAAAAVPVVPRVKSAAGVEPVAAAAPAAVAALRRYLSLHSSRARSHYLLPVPHTGQLHSTISIPNLVMGDFPMIS